ncbi:hypothetical protein V3481_008395 [Fusarium oxysporum f. sp. vasinfectum]|uniref:Up-regulated during septation protein 1 domain-containing protein n=2 Tax=Fusarium oxysporum f. sp. vasinfectum 25433 TaxID=1089449 RepID=X0M466_FUSOX|nr:hypothetical protein FOTG_03093 [Fusarium oxysporum f. sp. vasinfectum 25433]
MAHIAKCLVDIDTTYITKQASQSPNDSKLSPLPPQEKPFTWRMQQTDPSKKYQLFPKERKLPVLNSSKAVDPDKATMGPSITASDKTDNQQTTLNGLKKRLNQHSLARRRKISVPEVGPMTTVQELSMDSPTIPGRPPFHERSISAPGNSSRNYHLTDTFLFASSDDEGPDPQASMKGETEADSRGATPTSPRHLAPLVIPRRGGQSPLLRRQQSLNCFPVKNEPLRRGRTSESSPQSCTSFTPNSSMPDLTTPKSASTGSTTPIPVSAPLMEPQAESPQLSDGRYTPPVDSIRAGHRRGGSESSVMDRGRPRKRRDQRTNNGPIIQRTESKSRITSEQKAFEKLPVGVKHTEAIEKIEMPELALLQKQAYEQVGRFEVLRAEDVEALSKELRHLDEKTEYLRRTYTALRSGRKNLHSRICQYLRSPRVAKFSNESMLKQEEALTELDASIDDWVNKLEQAENRRTRVRQKLLEHVAAAACLPLGGPSMTREPVVSGPSSSGIGNISTPPRSPSKETAISPRTASSPSPQRVVAQVPSTILEQPVIEEEATKESADRVTSTGSLNRSDVESIRIYAGDDVYALLADVEDEITKMGKQPVYEPIPPNNLIETKRIELHRQRSHELLNGLSGEAHTMKKRDFSECRAISPLASPPTSSATKQNEQTEDDLPLLTNVVYRP